MALARNTRTGKIASVPNHYIGHPVLGKNLVSLTEEVQAAPKKEKPKKLTGIFSASEPQEEQPAPHDIKENEDIEDAN